MPIPRDRVLHAQKPLAVRIVEFLAADPTQAYNVIEIYAALEGFDFNTAVLTLSIASPATRAATLDPIEMELRALLSQGKVVAANHQGLSHFALAG